MKNKKNLVIGTAVLAAAFLLVSTAHANIFDSFINFLKGEGATSTEKLDEKTITEKKQLVELYKPVIEYEEAVTRAVELAEPSVVSIVVKKDLPIIENCPYDPFGNLPPEFQDFFGGGFRSNFYRPCETGTEKKEVGGGSGFIISSDGMIVTNKHVANDNKAEYVVLTNDGEKHEAKVLALDPVKDTAVLKIDATGLKPAKLGDSDSIKLGQTAIAIGNSLGQFRNTVSVGVISGLSRDITASGSGFSEYIEGVIQTDAAINQGNSGGPLLNLKGEVIGINTAMAAGAQNIGFALPINQIKKSIQSVRETGSIKVPYLGVSYITLDPETAKKQGLDSDFGALVRGNEKGPGVIPNSPAAKAGILAEDVILELNNAPLKNKTLGTLVQQYNVGDTISLKIKRGKGILTLKVRLEERPNL